MYPSQQYPTRPLGMTAVRPVADPVLGSALGGRLLVEARIGQGGLGVVYRARHLHLLQPVAVKVLHAHVRNDPAYRERFHAEARAASQLDHPSLVRVIDFGEEPASSGAPGMLWLAMEMLEGGTLDDRLAVEKRLPLAQALAIVLDIAGGLAHAHTRGIVHGDVKPGNVMLVARADDDGVLRERAKLCDFGLARVVRDTVDEVRGTPAYMSPEQCTGEPVDARSDVYALGVLLFELVTGELPFASDDPAEILCHHLVTEPPAPSSRIDTPLPARLDIVVARAMAKEPEYRYGSMRDFRAALREVLALITDEAEPTSYGSGYDAPARSPLQSEIRTRRMEAPSTEAIALAAAIAKGDVEGVARAGATLLARGGTDAEDALLVLDDPARLVPLATALLDHDYAATPYLDAVLARAGSAFAWALWRARVEEPWTMARRRRFVTWMTWCGGAGREVVFGALARLQPSLHEQVHPEVVEDLLCAVPGRPDTAFAAVVGLFCGSPHPRVRSLASAACAKAFP